MSDAETAAGNGTSPPQVFLSPDKSSELSLPRLGDHLYSATKPTEKRDDQDSVTVETVRLPVFAYGLADFADLSISFLNSHIFIYVVRF